MDNLGKIVSGATLRHMTYTVFDTDGTVIARHLSAEAAVVTVLTHSGRTFDIRRDKQGQSYSLWMPDEAGNLLKSDISSSAADAARAREEIFSSVIAASGSWQGPTIIDDATYDLQLAGFENE
jgi:hypothetical protein